MTAYAAKQTLFNETKRPQSVVVVWKLEGAGFRMSLYPEPLRSPYVAIWWTQFVGWCVWN